MLAGRDSVLAIHQDSNSGAALFVDGRLEYAAAEERYTRVRFQAGPPDHTLAAIRSRYDIGPDDASAVVAANVYSFVPGLPLPVLPHDGYDVLGWAHKTYLRYQDAPGQHRAARAVAARLTRGLVGLRLPRVACLVDHHTAHAYSAYMMSGFETAIAITIEVRRRQLREGVPLRGRSPHRSRGHAGCLTGAAGSASHRPPRADLGEE